MRKGQTAFELLTTYGWVILTTVVVAGTIAFLNFTKPDLFLEEDCSTGPEFTCLEQGLFETPINSSMLILLRNRNEEPLLNNSKVICYFGNDAIEVTFSNETEPGETIEILCTGPKQNWKLGSKIKTNFKIVYYTKYTASAIPEVSSGHLYAEVK